MAVSAIAFSSMQVSAQATFELNTKVTNALYPMHRTTPKFGDFNNDGRMDLYYGGVNSSPWRSLGILVNNLGDDNVEVLSQRVPDGEGLENDASPMVSGVAKTVYGNGNLFFDYNNDGNLDMLLMSRGDGDRGLGKGVLLYTNLGAAGDNKFEQVLDPGFRVWGTDHDKFNEGQEIGSMVVADYDKDGFMDIAIEGIDPEGKRYIDLYKNINGTGHFVNQLVANPLAFDNEPYPMGLYNQTEQVIDGNGNVTGGTFLPDQPTKAFKPLSHGAIAFGDLDADGWLDLVCTGYASDQGAGPSFRIYKNLQNGEFQDVTNFNLFDDYGVMKSFDSWGIYENGLKLIDFDGDGLLDIFLMGTMKGQDHKQASILMNTTDLGASSALSFTEIPWDQNLLIGAADVHSFLADYDGDGRVDVLYHGWSNEEGWNAFMFYQTYLNNYKRDNALSGVRYCDDGISFGDFNNDNKLDFAVSDWVTKDSVMLFTNKVATEITAPNAPENLTIGENENGTLTLNWSPMTKTLDDNTELKMNFNVFAKNKATGETIMLVPASIETGRLKTYLEFSNFTLANSYTFKNLPEGDYLVGVQAVNYAFAASPFTTKEITSVGIDNEVAASKAYAVVNGDEITVKAAANVDVKVYNISGNLVATGFTNKAITVKESGLYLIKVGNVTLKLVK